MIYKFSCLCLVILCLCTLTWAQIEDDSLSNIPAEKAEVLQQIDEDSVMIAPDSAALKNKALPINDPVKAALLSAVVPGLGQAYNGSFWKIPIIYGGFIGLGASIHYWNYNFINFRNALSAITDDNPETENIYVTLNEANLNRRVEFYQRNRDFLMIITGLYYLLNVVEAYVDAHLKTFDISDEIALKIDPHVGQFAFNHQFGLSVKLQFK